MTINPKTWEEAHVQTQKALTRLAKRIAKRALLPKHAPKASDTRKTKKIRVGEGLKPKLKHHRVAKRRGVEIPAKIRSEVKARAGGFCEIRVAFHCQVEGIEIHHRKNRSQGGSNEPRNLLLGCYPCHHAVTLLLAGTERFRTLSWQPEGTDVLGNVWQPRDNRENLIP